MRRHPYTVRPALLGLVVPLAALIAAMSSAQAASAADGCPNAEFRTGPSAQLPECRAYELVSAGDKLGGMVDEENAESGGFSHDGEHALFPSAQGFDGSVHTAGTNQYGASRGPDGWAFHPLRAVLPADAVLPIVIPPADWTVDFSRQVVETGLSYDASDPGGDDVYIGNASDLATWVSRPRVGDAPSVYAGMSADGGHILFRSTDPLDPREADPATGRVVGDGLYDRTGGRTVPVGLANDGTLTNRCGATVAGGSPNNAGSGVNAVSDDGRRIFFTTGVDPAVDGCSDQTDEAGQLYARIDGERTVLVSPRRRDVPDATRELPHFVAATADGSRVLFTSRERLTNSEPADATGARLYAFDLPTPNEPDGVLTDLTPHTVDTTGAPTNGDPNVREFGSAFVGMSDDGSRVYFVAAGQLTADATAPGLKLYVSDRGDVKLVTPASVEIQPSGRQSTRNKVSPDGSKLAFTTVTNLPDYEDRGDMRKLYLYDLASGVPPTCLSCPPDGSAPTADSFFYGFGSGDEVSATRSFRGQPRNVTDDGRVFFQAGDPLVTRDVNGRDDVYEYLPGQGLRLISTGRDVDDSLVIGASADGTSVAFSTFESLLPQDTDNGDRDVYVARIGGGFPSHEDSGTCLADDCQGPLGSPPGERSPGSVGFVGAGDASGRGEQSSAATFHVRRLSAKQRQAWARRGRVALRVRVSAPGRIRARARARLGKRTARVASASRTVRRGGAATLMLKLSKRARVYLRRHGTLRLSLAVSYSRLRGAQRASLTLRTAPKAARRPSGASRGGRR